MKLLRNLVPLFILLSEISTTTAEKWYSLGNYIEEEGSAYLAGHCVANSLDGNVIAVASPHFAPEVEDDDEVDEDNEKDPTPSIPVGKRYGRVAMYGFDANTDEWNKLGDELVGEEGQEFGTSLDMSENGNVIIVGTMDDNGDKSQAGSVQVYVRDDVSGKTRWLPKGDPIYGESAYDWFGASVAIHGDGKIIVVGSPGHDVGDNIDAGAVTVYEYEALGKKWVEMQAKILGTSTLGKFGSSLAISKLGVLAVGAPHANNQAGYVQMFRYTAADNNGTAATWSKEGQELDGGNPGDRFGASVAMSRLGKHVIIGAPLQKVGEKRHAGVATVWEVDYTDNVWKLISEEISSDNQGDNFGSSVDISDDGKEIAVGAPYSSTSTMKQNGHIAVYHKNSTSTTFSLANVKIEGKAEYGHQGSSVALSGDGYQVMGGAPEEGYVSVYMLAKTAPPTLAPTTYEECLNCAHDDVKKADDGSRGRGGFAKFILVIFIISIVAAAGSLAFKGVLHYRNKRSMGVFQPTANTDLELRNVEDQDQSGGVI